MLRRMVFVVFLAAFVIVWGDKVTQFTPEQSSWLGAPVYDGEGIGFWAAEQRFQSLVENCGWWPYPPRERGEFLLPDGSVGTVADLPH